MALIAIDYDGTITKDGGDYPNVGEIKEGCIEALKELQEHCQIALWTCRSGKTLEDALMYLKSFGFEPDYINEMPYTTGSPKIIASTYIDDRAFPYTAVANDFWIKWKKLLVKAFS